MGTPYETIYSAFLSKVLEDDWGKWTIEEVEMDIKQIMLAALPWFKFPRNSLELSTESINPSRISMSRVHLFKQNNDRINRISTIISAIAVHLISLSTNFLAIIA